MKNVLLLVLLLLGGVPSFAAESYRELYVKPSATNASNINGGSSEERLFRRTNGNWNTSTKVFTATGDTLDSSWVGHVACVCADGTTTGAYFAVITAIDNTAKTITLSSSLTVGSAPATSTTARTITIGGAWTGMSGSTLFPTTVSFTGLCTLPQMPRINFCGDFSVTSTIALASMVNHVCAGCTTTPGDGGISKWQFDGSGDVSVTSISGTSASIFLDSIWIRNQSTHATGLSARGVLFTPTSGVLTMRRCRVSDCKQEGIYVGGPCDCVLDQCEVYNCLTAGSPNSGAGSVYSTASTAFLSVSNSIVHDCPNGTAAIYTAGSSFITDTVFENCYAGVYGANSGCTLKNCVIANCTYATRIVDARTIAATCLATVFVGNTNVAEIASSNQRNMHIGCAYYNNTNKVSGSGFIQEIGTYDLTRSCLVDPENGDFRTRESSLRGRVDAAPPQSSSYYSKTMSLRRTPGIEPSNPFYRLAP